jgi:hypothetical protein
MRTPYGASAPKDSIQYLFKGYQKAFGINVSQNIRGRNGSEGVKDLHPPITHAYEPGTTDESTDTWDTIDWLMKNLNGHNGKVGLTGCSYPGWLALVGAIDPHPALKCVIEAACMADLWLGDDFHHNGAFRLEYSFGYTWGMQMGRGLGYSDYDLYDFFLKMGSLKNVNSKYFHDSITAWNEFIDHPDYNEFWNKNSPLSYMHHPQVPILHRGGYYDQEDINGPQLMFSHLEKKDTFNRNFLFLGPWNHCGTRGIKVDSLGVLSFSNLSLADSTQNFLGKWFAYWLKGKGENDFSNAKCYQTGSDKWQNFDIWPPKNITIQKLYAGANNTCSFNQPEKNEGFASYISDPARPVPYRKHPITFDGGWNNWHIEDQRFVYSRPDVVNFQSDTLTEDLTVTGKIIAHLFASTSESDADWVIKLIDVYPDNYQKNVRQPDYKMNGYQFPVAMEVFRGRYRKSFSNPSPLTPNKPEEFIIDLHDINHVFKKGHRLMIQVQSTWFPIIDRNPQKYVPNIFLANESDFIKAEHRIYFSKKYPTYIELPVMKE